MTDELRVARFADLDPATLYALLRLRMDVFVVEQACPYPEIDGRDAEPDALHLWYERHGEPVAYLRILTEPDGDARIGRVCTAPYARGEGLAGQLVAAALERIGDRPCQLNSQVQLVDFYQRYDFAVTGPEFLDDGIPHVPMRR